MTNRLSKDQTTTDSPASNIGFRMMSVFINRRNRKHPPELVLKEAGVKEGFKLLDFGCGPGGHSIAAAGLVGERGKVYALDIHPLAIKKVREVASKKGLENVELIQSDCATGLDSASLDMVLLYDIFHGLADPEGVLRELYRILKPDAVLSVNDHHMRNEVLVSKIEQDNLFKLSGRGKNFFTFCKKEAGDE